MPSPFPRRLEALSSEECSTTSYDEALTDFLLPEVDYHHSFLQQAYAIICISIWCAQIIHST